MNFAGIWQATVEPVSKESKQGQWEELLEDLKQNNKE